MLSMAETKEVWVPIVDDDVVLAEDERPPMFPAGVRVTLSNGVSAFYSYRHHTISVTFPGVPMTYRSNTPVVNSVGVQQIAEPKKNEPVKMEQFIELYGREFVLLVLDGIARAQAERN